jgi:hypothetical protein
MKTKLTVLMAVILIGLASTAFAIVDESGAQNQQEAMVVKNPNGESVGTVTNVLVDSFGNIGFIIVGIGEATGNGKKEVVVPVIIFAYDGQSQTLFLDMTKEQLTAAPEFNVSDLDDPAYAGRIYQYYGVAPSWTE